MHVVFEDEALVNPVMDVPRLPCGANISMVHQQPVSRKRRDLVNDVNGPWHGGTGLIVQMYPDRFLQGLDNCANDQITV
jgi:hypothetical protein